MIPGRVLPPGLVEVELPTPCPGCHQRAGYYDTRTDKHVCAKCGRNVKQRDEARP